ncbi:hypothetical protein BG006_005018 [Podila minutissima]|uniref:F-box domain-containing protein n=1 Tax=Podila minutissima TaxID=64525 RepID=A0A9P5SL07_9FUNG|nr:hypothetical protein BG006_005018 [Podila minutissima]
MIAQPLLFKDLLSCILVSRAWHDALIRILWLDIVTYRSYKPKSLIWNYIHYFHTLESHQVLARHARHIRAVTCQGPDILHILLTSGCTHLVEINYLTRRSQPQRGLDLLASLVALCPNLRAVAVENLFYKSSETASDLIDFVTLLDSYPSVTCLYLEGNLHLQSLKKPLLEILQRRLARVDTENVASLSFRDKFELTRAKRGPPKAMTHGDTRNKKRGAVTFRGQQYHWPGRESPLTEKVPNYDCNRQLEDESLGRWEFERRQTVLGGGTLAVLATNENSALEVCLPTLFWSDFYGGEQETLLESILKRFPALRRLSSGDSDDIANRLARTLPWNYLPHLREIDLQGASESCLEEFMDDPPSGRAGAVDGQSLVNLFTC